MISLIISFFLIAPFIVFENKNSDSKYFNYAASISIAYASLGLISLLFISLKLTFIPLYIILIFLFLIFNLQKQYRYRLLKFCDQFSEEIIIIKNLKKQKITLGIFSFLIIILFILSIGPINHSDTANIYVGYPHKFLIQNSHFIDGNLNQGLMGIGDFANIFFLQEKTTWLIRSSQFIPLFFVFMYMLKRQINNIFIFTFLSSPVMIQWLTIGKNNFLSETALALAFLVWERNKEKEYITYIICLSFIAISFKISALLISLPILIYLAYYYRYSFLNINIRKIIKGISLPLIFSLICLTSIFFYRNTIIHNPFYPLLTGIFNNGDQQLSDWEQTLRGWDRQGLYPLWIFIPKSIGKISFVLGIANLFLFINAIVVFFKNLISKNALLNIVIFQFFLLIIFAQGRADYYMTPLILINFATPILSFKKLNLRNMKFSKFINKSFLLLTFSQFIMFLISALYSISLTLYVIYDYEEGMNKTAYNFYNSKKIEELAIMPVYSEVSGMTHLFFDEPFIANQKFERCFYYGENISDEQKYKFCMQKEGVKTIVVNNKKLENSEFFSCQKDFLKRVSRNIFLEKKIDVDFCQLK